jgi:hypothetical protein
MTRVVAIAKGFYKRIRVKGDVFDAPFSDEQIARSSWLAPAGTPLPVERVIPTNRNARMVDVIQGIWPEEAEDVYEPDTMSELARRNTEQQEANPRAYGLVPVAAPAQSKPTPERRRRRMRSDKGKKRGPRTPAPATTEVTP